jgi:hypothetical protein
MTQYRDQSFSQRFSSMGDEAEGVYKAVTPLGNTTQFGFRRPQGVRFSSFPVRLRHMPDFVTATHMVEVMGMGRDGILKSMKVTKYEALKIYNQIAPKLGLLGLVVFIWNSALHQFVVVQWAEIVKEVAYSKRKYGVQAFENDGNEYYPLHWDRLIKCGIPGTYNPE